MMSTPYCSSPIEKLMNSTRPEVRDSLGFWRQSSWLDEPFDVVWSAGSMFTLFAHQQNRPRKNTHRHADCHVRRPRPETNDFTSRTNDFDAQTHDASGKLTTR